MNAVYTDFAPVLPQVINKNLSGTNIRNPRITVKKMSILEKIQTIAEEITFVNRQGEYENHLKKVIEESYKFGQGKLLPAKERYLAQLPDINFSQVNHVFQKLLSVKQPTPDQISNLVNFFFHDKSEQFAVLNYLEAKISNERAKTKRAIELARQKLLKSSAREVYAGLNIAFDAQDLSRISKTAVSNVLQFYRDVILNYYSLAKTYNIIIEKYGANNFFNVAKFLLNGLSKDINSENSSTDPIFLEVVLRDIYKLQELVSIHEISEQLLIFLYRSHNVKLGKNAAQVTNIVLQAATNQGLTLDDIQRIFSKMNISNNRLASLMCLNYLSTMLHQFPQDIFVNNKIQDNSLKAIIHYSSMLSKMETSNVMRRI